MNSLSSAGLASSSSPPVPGGSPITLPFPYAEVSPGPRPRSDGAEESKTPNVPDPSPLVPDAAGRAHQLGREEGQTEARRNFDDQLARERSAIAAALAQFTRDRGAYYTKLEAEVVQLALAIARRILHREAQVDPLLLAGLVRVALEKIEGATGVLLRVHPQVAAGWKRYLAEHMDPGDIPELVEDSSLDPGLCLLETSMGTSQLGVELQLKEIEQGFMDLLAARPQENS
jgi:flagellar biosynthesis/type III secretory pathway protein FliH